MGLKKKDKNLATVKFPLGVKLAFILGTIVLLSLGVVTVLNSFFIGEDVKITAEENNLSLNARAAGTANEKLKTIRSNVLQLLDLTAVVSGGKDSALSRQAQAFFFERNSDIASIHVLDSSGLSEGKSGFLNWNILNRKFFQSNEIDEVASENFLKASKSEIERSCAGETLALNASPYFGIATISLFLPYKENGLPQTCAIIFSAESLSEILGMRGTNETFLINDSDELLLHPDNEKILRAENLKNHPLIQAIRNENQNNVESRQIPFEITEDGITQKFFGAYQTLSLADLTMLTIIPLDSVLEGVTATRNNNILLTIIVFCLSTIIILFYSRFGISIPIKRLSLAAAQIQDGNFDSEKITLNLKRKDEIGVLNNATLAEFGFLNTFAKFTNHEVAKAIARNEIDFEPHLKDLTIFFSDIRGFTKISDGFKKRFGSDSPREIIEFLNDYMRRMVECITLSGGVVDKFEGDAIMALWGIMRSDSLDYEKMSDDNPKKLQLKREHFRHIKEDALSAIKGSLSMRYALMEYNKEAKIYNEKNAGKKYKPMIKIGRGLNTGRATAGILGSKDKMEYTAIGDAVNFASRTEASNKACGTDMLISEDTYNILKRQYIKCKENNFSIRKEFAADEIIVEKIPVAFEVKGKGLQHFFAVVNMPNFDIEKFFRAKNPNFVLDADCARALGKTGPKNLSELRNLLGIATPNFSKVNLNEEENKIQVKQ